MATTKRPKRSARSRRAAPSQKRLSKAEEKAIEAEQAEVRAKAEADLAAEKAAVEVGFFVDTEEIKPVANCVLLKELDCRGYTPGGLAIMEFADIYQVMAAGPDVKRTQKGHYIVLTGGRNEVQASGATLFQIGVSKFAIVPEVDHNGVPLILASSAEKPQGVPPPELTSDEIYTGGPKVLHTDSHGGTKVVH